jgi:hypothetical protein
MSIVFALSSVAQLVAIAFLLWVAIENSRAFTLSKNSEWLQGNPEFKEKFKKCSPAFILISFGTVLLATLFNVLNNSVQRQLLLRSNDS